MQMMWSSSFHDLQCALEQLKAVYETTGVNSGLSKSDVMALNWKKVHHSLQVKGQSLTQEEKYPKVLFRRDGKIEQYIVRWIRDLFALMW